MLGEIAFDHPLFASLAGASSMISPRSASGSIDVSIPIAGGFAGAGAVRERRRRDHRETRSARAGWSSWRADGSPPTASSPGRRKFVPLMTALLEDRHRSRRRPVVAAKTVGDRLPLPRGRNRSRTRSSTSLMEGPSRSHHRKRDLRRYGSNPESTPVDTPAGTTSFAVNLDPLESKTAPLAGGDDRAIRRPSGEPFPEDSRSRAAQANVQCRA